MAFIAQYFYFFIYIAIKFLSWRIIIIIIMEQCIIPYFSVQFIKPVGIT